MKDERLDSGNGPKGNQLLNNLFFVAFPQQYGKCCLYQGYMLYISETFVDQIHSQEDMVNNFCTLGCRMVRLGNYEVAPRGKLLTTEAFVQMKVPRITGAGGKKGSDFVTVEISWKEVVNALAYFGKELPILFLFLSPKGSRKLREILKMRNRFSFFIDSCAGQDNSQRRITIHLSEIRREEVLSLKSQLKGKLHEIKLVNAENIFKQSAPSDLGCGSPRNSFGRRELPDLVVRVSKSLKDATLVFVVWQEAAEGSGLYLDAVFLETRHMEKKGEWVIEQRKDFDGAPASTPMASRLIVRLEDERELRIRGVDKAGEEHFSNKVFLKA